MTLNQLLRLKLGDKVRIIGREPYNGRITTVNPVVNDLRRNIWDDTHELQPGIWTYTSAIGYLVLFADQIEKAPND